MRKLLVFCALLFVAPVFAQDIHWSQYNDNPVFQNPGNSGRFQGDYRLHANYRDQWRSVTVPFRTLSFSGDMKFRERPEIGLGALFFSDVAGDGKFRTVELQIAPSYQFKLTPDSTHTLRFGIQAGLNHRQVNFAGFSFDAQFNGTYYDPSLGTNELYQQAKNTNISVGTGAVYEYYVHPRRKISGGIAFFNLNRPNQGFYGDKIQRDIRMNLFAKAQYKLNYDWDILPSLMVQLQGKYKEIIFGSTARYILLDRLGEYRAVYFGAFFRNRDAGYVSAGLDYQNWYAGVSYDLNFSKLVPASNARGGLEVSLRYILTSFKPKKVIHRVCPDYI